MRSRMPMILGSTLVLCLAAMIAAAAVGDIIEIKGDLIDRSKSNSQLSFGAFPTGVADVIITEIDSSAFPVIKVYVDVIDSFGVLLCGLTEEDFCVSQDGQSVDFELSSLDSVPCPTSVCLVLDISGSMFGQPLKDVKQAAGAFVRNMGPDSRTAIVTYQSCVETLQTFTNDTTVLLNAINSLDAYGTTALFDGFWLGTDLTCAESNIRAVIGFTDGQENNSQACWPPPNGQYDPQGWDDDCDLVASYADSCGFPIYTIGVGNDAWPDPLICLAQNTGGQYYYAPTTAQLDSIYQDIQGRLCCRYLITYTSPDTDCVTHQVIVCEGGELCTPCDTGYYRGLFCPPTLRRTPPTIALSDECQPPGEDLVIEAWATDSVPPPVQEVDLFWRITGSGPAYAKIIMTHMGDSLYHAVIPGAALPPGTPSVDYYLTATDGDYDVSDPPENPETTPYLIEICGNRPPVLTCPDDDSVHAGGQFTSTDYSVTDPDDPEGSIVVSLQSVSPTPTNAPGLVSKHVEWNSTCADLDIGPLFTITLVATDPHGAKDTCDFTVRVYNYPPEITCPDDDSVHADGLFQSSDFSSSDPDGDQVTVSLCGITPTPVNQPVIVESYVEWQTACADTGKTFTICLKAVDDCGDADSCHFDVKVYNQPPEITCPEDDSVYAEQLFVSGKFEFSDPEDDEVTASLCGITPAPANPPAVVGDHVEWQTACADVGKLFTICLKATDECGAADSCDFDVTVYALPPEIVCPEDDSVHAAENFVSSDFSVNLPDAMPTPVCLCGVDPAPTNQPTIVGGHVEWQTECEDAGKTFTICLKATGDCGLADTCHFQVTAYNRPPQLTCPEDGGVTAEDTFISSDFSATDPDGDSAPVTFLKILPSATNAPTLVGNHVEWVTTMAELGDYVIYLVATDPCGLADTCEFVVTVDEPTGDFTCPEDDSVHAGELFVSTDYALTYPECDPSSVEILDVTPAATHNPVLVAYHVQWLTTCAEDGDYVIRLRTNESCSVEDTCSFLVTVYNRPPELTCPDYGHVEPLGLFISTDFLVSDPDGDKAIVSLLGIDPPAEHDPVIVERHVEWQTECLEGDYVITLMAVDPCGLADTCEFMVTVSLDPPSDFSIWIYPFTQYVAAGHAAGFIVELGSLHGYAKPCTLLVSGLPAPPNHGLFDQAVLVPTDTTTLTVYTTVATPVGSYTLTVTGKEKAGLIQHSVQVQLEVGEPSDAGEDIDNPNAPESFALFQNQPNPFNPETQISYYLPADREALLVIYNVLGRTVRTLLDGYQNAGMHTVTWDGKNDDGTQLSSGIYFYRLKTRDFDQTKKMVLMK